jgi:hypothetical protein
MPGLTEKALKRQNWIMIGAMVGFFAGLPFGTVYAIAGIGIGMAGGIGISLAMRPHGD